MGYMKILAMDFTRQTLYAFVGSYGIDCMQYLYVDVSINIYTNLSFLFESMWYLVIFINNAISSYKCIYKRCDWLSALIMIGDPNYQACSTYFKTACLVGIVIL